MGKSCCAPFPLGVPHDSLVTLVHLCGVWDAPWSTSSQSPTPCPTALTNKCVALHAVWHHRGGERLYPRGRYARIYVPTIDQSRCNNAPWSPCLWAPGVTGILRGPYLVYRKRAQRLLTAAALCNNTASTHSSAQKHNLRGQAEPPKLLTQVSVVGTD
jgi:hypothetical protein